MTNLPKTSVIIPTRDRPEDLSHLLLSILRQRLFPLEVIVVDDSLSGSTKRRIRSFNSMFASINCKLRHLKGNRDGLPAARNLGVSLSEGEAVLFLDDDTFLDKNVISTLAAFLKNNGDALGVQPKIIAPIEKKGKRHSKFYEAIYKAFMLSYEEMDNLFVRRSGLSIFPSDVTKPILVQRLSGCCSCYRRKVFEELSFDTNLKLWGYMEDLDFSYRVLKLHPNSLYAIPDAVVIHSISEKSRLPMKLVAYMRTTYWFYVFFKDILEGSMTNLAAFLWALTGNLFINFGELVVKKKKLTEWWGLIYLLGSYFYNIRSLKRIIQRDMDFFNKNLRKLKA